MIRNHSDCRKPGEAVYRGVTELVPQIHGARRRRLQAFPFGRLVEGRMICSGAFQKSPSEKRALNEVDSQTQ